MMAAQDHIVFLTLFGSCSALAFSILATCANISIIANDIATNAAPTAISIVLSLSQSMVLNINISVAIEPINDPRSKTMPTNVPNDTSLLPPLEATAVIIEITAEITPTSIITSSSNPLTLAISSEVRVPTIAAKAPIANTRKPNDVRNLRICFIAFSFDFNDTFSPIFNSIDRAIITVTNFNIDSSNDLACIKTF